MSKIHLRQRIEGQLFETAWIPWLSVRLDPRQVFHGKLEPREVIVSQPTLRLCRRRDGTWNLQGLVADPWPGPVIQEPAADHHSQRHGRADRRRRSRGRPDQASSPSTSRPPVKEDQFGTFGSSGRATRAMAIAGSCCQYRRGRPS